MHRDLKPDNIMIGHHGEVVVVDWGLATTLDSEEPRLPAQDAEADSTSERDPTGIESSSFTTRDGSILGTPRYMSPEQASGEFDKLDAWSDLYSLAMIFYEIFTLHHPLPGLESNQPPAADLRPAPLRPGGLCHLHGGLLFHPRVLKPEASVSGPTTWTSQWARDKVDSLFAPHYNTSSNLMRGGAVW